MEFDWGCPNWTRTNDLLTSEEWRKFLARSITWTRFFDKIMPAYTCARAHTQTINGLFFFYRYNLACSFLFRQNLKNNILTTLKPVCKTANNKSTFWGRFCKEAFFLLIEYDNRTPLFVKKCVLLPKPFLKNQRQ